MHSNKEPNWKELLSVAGLFLKLGAISFGGPAAHVALMEQEVVRKRGWLDREHFLDLLAATNLVPGPNATEMAIHIGYVRAGWLGFLAAGIAFILPAFLISLALSWVYVHFGTLPEGQALFYGINPVVMAIILVATYRLGKTALKVRAQIFLGLLAFGAALLGANEMFILLVAGSALPFNSAAYANSYGIHYAAPFRHLDSHCHLPRYYHAHPNTASLQSYTFAHQSPHARR